MIEIKAPEKIPNVSSPKIFLAGSIEEGRAEPWQEHVTRLFVNDDVTILNPRRDEWDPSWEQKIENIEFKQQVEWELNGLDMADHIIFYLDPKTKSPITLLELGLHAASGRCLMVCPEGFWRKGNLDIIAERNGIPQFKTLEGCVEYLRKKALE